MKKDTDDKRERILSAAQECFLQYGFKRTSMDDIARTANISRAALYLLFTNKEAIFRTRSEQLHDAAFARAELALQEERPFTERFVAAFEGRDLEFLELMQKWTHGSELADLNHGIGADIAQRAERTFHDLLTKALSEALSRREIALERIGLDPSQCAELLIRTVSGLKYTPDLVQYRQLLAQLIQVFWIALAPEEHSGDKMTG